MKPRNSGMQNLVNNLVKGAILAGVVGFGLTACTNPSTPAGEEGYVYEKPRIFGEGGYQGTMKGPANYGVSLLRNEVVNIDMRPNTYTETFRILANDDLNIKFDFHAVIGIQSGSVKTVVEEYEKTVFVEEALHRIVEVYYRLGLVEEAKKSAAILGYNYQSGEWYERSYKVFNKKYKTKKINEKKEMGLIRKKIKGLFE